MPLSDCTDLTSYLQAYGTLLGHKATRALDPLHVPNRDPLPPGVRTIDDHFRQARNSRLFGAQADVLAGLTRLWDRGEKSAFLIGECGTGKSAMGAAACHVHANGRPYRALVMAPDHLIPKWCREIAATCPGAVAKSFGDWKDVLALAMDHAKPTTAEWWVMGRDQSKGDPLWEPRFATRRVLGVERDAVARLRALGASWDDITQKVACCPRCGHVVQDSEGVPLAIDDLKTRRRQCEGTVVRHKKDPDGVAVAVGTECKEPLWQFVADRTPKRRAEHKLERAARGLKPAVAPYRWAPCRIVHTRMRRHFDYLVLDEVHELKSSETAQANSAGSLAASARKVVAMTGTLIGGYADHLFPILMRLSPDTLVKDGLGWKDVKKFQQTYGIIETTTWESSKEKAWKELTNGEDNSHSKGSGRRKVERCRPGIMPQLFGDHLMERAVFLSLEQVSEGLPALAEEIVPVLMDDELGRAYRQMEGDLRDALKDMLMKGNKSLLGPMLNALLGYLDFPYGWGTVGYTKDGQYFPVTNCADLDPAVVRNKEQALIQVCRREKAQGRKAWVYLQMTDLRDVGQRLQGLLQAEGLKVGYLRSSVKRSTREQWIYKHAPGFDVVLSHPRLVETGLDLFALDGNHNFPTLIFDQVGYNLFTQRQASRRSWRIGQPLPCRTVFLYYAGTMQERCIALTGRKLAAAEALEGKFSAEGLAAMGEESDATMALARALADRVEVESTWRRDLGYGDVAPVGAIVVPSPKPVVQFTAAELATLDKMFARLKGKTRSA